MWWPAGKWEGLSRGLYRLAYCIVLPVRFLSVPFINLGDGHFITARHCVMFGFAAPMFYALLYGLLLLMRAHARRRAPDGEPPTGAITVNRRVFLKRSISAGVWTAFIAVPTYSVAIAPSRLRIHALTLKIRDLPLEFEGLRIAHVSDTHYGPFISRNYLENAFARINAEHPDLILLTGDYVHRTLHGDVPGIGLLGLLQARLGCVAVLGNHDHWEGAHRCRAAFKRIGIPLVDNQRMFLTAQGLQPELPPAGVAALCIGGLGDVWEDEQDFDAALRDVPENMPRILLSHNPDSAELTPTGTRVDLMLCGHTHGGQVRLPLIGAPLAPIRHNPKYLAGLCQGPAGPVLVSNGVGMTVLPLRIGAPPEFGMITLTRG